MTKHIKNHFLFVLFICMSSTFIQQELSYAYGTGSSVGSGVTIGSPSRSGGVQPGNSSGHGPTAIAPGHGVVPTTQSNPVGNPPTNILVDGMFSTIFINNNAYPLNYGEKIWLCGMGNSISSVFTTMSGASLKAHSASGGLFVLSSNVGNGSNVSDVRAYVDVAGSVGAAIVWPSNQAIAVGTDSYTRVGECLAGLIR